MGGICVTGGQKNERAIAIEQTIKDDLRENRFTIRVLILGTTACGKSTVAKQMKILHGEGFSDEERHNYKKILILNLFYGMKELVIQAEKFNIKVLRKNKKAAKFFADSNPYTAELNEEVAQKAVNLWEDKGIEKTFSKRNLFDIPPNMVFIMDNINRISKPDFVPDNDDILHARQRTTGIAETRFKKDRYTWCIIDVGGQRTERRKWMNCFSGVNAVIYVAALDEFDIVNPEDPEGTRMEESLEVFKQTVNNPLFKEIAIILFLNKTDMFKTKIKMVEMSKTFPDYDGGSDFDIGSDYIKSKYYAQVQQPTREVYVHKTCAIDTERISFVFRAVMDTIFKQRLKVSGL